MDKSRSVGRGEAARRLSDCQRGFGIRHGAAATLGSGLQPPFLHSTAKGLCEGQRGARLGAANTQQERGILKLNIVIKVTQEVHQKGNRGL